MRFYYGAIFFLAVALMGMAAGAARRQPDETMPLVTYGRVLDVPQMVVAESGRVGVPAHLALAISFRESRLTNIISRPGGDFGPLQVHGRTARARGVDILSLGDAQTATRLGVQWLGEYLRDCRNVREAVDAYAAGRCHE